MNRTARRILKAYKTRRRHIRITNNVTYTMPYDESFAAVAVRENVTYRG